MPKMRPQPKIKSSEIRINRQQAAIPQATPFGSTVASTTRQRALSYFLGQL